jgi:hypothetical protein
MLLDNTDFIKRGVNSVQIYGFLSPLTSCSIYDTNTWKWRNINLIPLLKCFLWILSQFDLYFYNIHVVEKVINIDKMPKIYFICSFEDKTCKQFIETRISGCKSKSINNDTIVLLSHRYIKAAPPDKPK